MSSQKSYAWKNSDGYNVKIHTGLENCIKEQNESTLLKDVLKKVLTQNKRNEKHVSAIVIKKKKIKSLMWLKLLHVSMFKINKKFK